MTQSDQKLAFNYLVADLLLLTGSYFVFFVGNTPFTEKNFLFLLNYYALWLIVGYFTKIYFIHLHNGYRYRLSMYLRTHLIFIGILSFLFLINDRLIPLNRKHLVDFMVCFMVTELISHYLLVHAIGFLRKKGKNVRKALIIGNNEISDRINTYFSDNMDLGYRVVHTLDGQLNTTTQLDTVHDFLKNTFVDEIIIANHQDEVVESVVKISDYYGIRTRIIPNTYPVVGGNNRISSLGGLPIINVRETSLDKFYLTAQKRVFDIVFSFIALAAGLPFFGLIALAIRLESKGPVFYCPVRLGQGGRKFKLYKFRSMYQCDDAVNGTMSTTANDSRVTVVGAFIRKYSIDEIPQFINVLLGDMSVVGPRPHRIQLNKIMQQEVDKYMVRHYLKPGITGWAQVNGWRGPTVTNEQKQQRTFHDLWYLENWSFLLDIKIIFMTVFTSDTYKNAF